MAASPENRTAPDSEDSILPVFLGGIGILAAIFVGFEALRGLLPAMNPTTLYAFRGLAAGVLLLGWGIYSVRRNTRMHTRKLEVIIKRRTWELAESEAKLHLLWEADLVGLVAWNADGSIEDANDTFLRLVGYSREDLQAGRVGWRDLTPPEFARLDDEALREIAARGACTPFEKEYRRKDGTRVPILIGAASFETDPRRGVCFVLDQRTRVSLEHQLRQSQKLEAIGTLAGGIAHDFNNILTAIGGFAELALLKMEGHSAEGEIREVMTGVKRATDLTRQLLAFSRKQVLRPRLISVNEVVLSMEKMLRRLLGEQVELVVVLGPALGPARVDPSQLEQVLLNLAINARDAMPDGGQLTIETGNAELDESYVATRPDVEPGPYVMMGVTDTGIGMDAATVSRVFEPFFTTKPQGQGTGLGLSTVHGIIKQSGGHIAVYSEPGKGTAFKVYLRRVEGQVEKIHRETDHRELPGGTETVLVVEDEIQVRNLAVAILTKLGYRVLSAPGGEEALRLADQPFALLLTDLVMPGMSGRQLAERLTAVKPGLRVLYMSGYTENVIVHRGELDPGVSFLPKPFTAASLARLVREVLDEKPGT